MKRYFSVLLCFLVVVFCLPTAAASAQVTTTAAASALQRGDTVTLTVQVKDSPSVTSMAVTMGEAWDDSVFSFVSARWLLSGGMISDVDTERLNAVIMFSSARSFDGAVFEITLKVKDTAPFGDTTLQAGAVLGAAAEGNAVTYVGSKVTISCSHSWKAADCAYPKSCSHCGITDGAALGHDYAGGVCSRCGLTQQQAATTTTTTLGSATTTTTGVSNGTTASTAGVVTTTGATDASATTSVSGSEGQTDPTVTQTTGESGTTATTQPTQDAVSDLPTEAADGRVFLVLCAAVVVGVATATIAVWAVKNKKK